jgi:hypothetical protein
MWSSGYGGGAAWRNSGDLAGDSGGGVLGKALGVVGDQLVCGFGAGWATGERHGGDRAAVAAGGVAPASLRFVPGNAWAGSSSRS